MEIQIRGCPKSGTHWLEAIYQRDGWETRVHHLPYHRKVKGRWDPVTYNGEVKVACIFREPRDMIISWVRHNGESLNQENIINRIHKYYRGTFVEDYLSYLPYWHDDRVIKHQFWDLFKEPPIDSLTKTGNHSNWEPHWTGKIDNAYRETGGYELETELVKNGIYINGDN